ncbi:MAG: hypothetical protein EPN82_04935 [Bacteroidetes bacterium]|nr:MAG: hypothetical protein EPN82_04935 [Bacteroidota bacterium]
MQKIELIVEEIKLLQEEQIDIVHTFISKFCSSDADPIYADKDKYDGDIPEDIALNHDSYL